MSMFTIRIELHNGQATHYAALAKSLAAVGITDIVTADNGTRYRMSPAEYNFVGETSIDSVYQASVGAATATGLKFAVFVSQCSVRKWIGLQAIQ